MATHSCYKYRRLFTSSFRILTRNSHFQTTTIRFPNENSSVTLNRYYRHQYKRQIRYVHAFHAPTQTMHVSSMQQQKYVVVRERSLSHFKEEWIRILRECEVAEPFWSVKWIVEHVLRKHPHSEDRCADLSLSQLDAANEMLNKRIQRIPVQYIIGEWDFRNVTLLMQPPVFIPEPETEILVELVLSHWCGHSSSLVEDKEREEGDRITFLDLCCGSGAIAISLLHDNPRLRGYAIDQSEEAMALTKENAHRNHVSDRLDVYHCHVDRCVDLFHHQLGLRFDLIISNPPYIPSADIPHLQREITEYYDRKALDGGEKGLKIIREVLSLCRHIMKPKGQIWLESGPDHTGQIQQLLDSHLEWELLYKSNHKDHLGRERFHQIKKL